MPSTKQLIFHEDARDRIRKGMDTVAKAVCVTLGPRGRTVVLESESGHPQIVNSGVVVARVIALEDNFENMGAQLLREVASRTSEMAGDGTTTATVLAQSMIHHGLRYLGAGMNPMDIKHGMDLAIAAVVRTLQSMAKPCSTVQQIAHVASISANNDSSIGDLVSAAIEKVGRDGAIVIENGSGLTSVLDVAEGLQFDRGFLSPFFINTVPRQMVVLEDVSLLLCDGRISLIKDILPLLEEVVKAKRPLLVIAEDVDGDALSALVINTINGSFRACAVRSPGFGDQRQALLLDIAAITGARLVSDTVGLTLANVTLADLGHARRVEVSRISTTIIGGAGQTEAIQERLAGIRTERAAASNQYEREKLDSRASKLSCGVALIRVGATTDIELSDRKLRTEDALHAARAAVDEGIVPGGGVALLRARHALSNFSGYNFDESSGIELVKLALEEPLRRIAINAGRDASVVLNRINASDDPEFGYNASAGSYGNLLQMGIMDPAKVTRCALQNAGSIASMILTTDCLIAQCTPSGQIRLGSDEAIGRAVL